MVWKFIISEWSKVISIQIFDFWNFGMLKSNILIRFVDGVIILAVIIFLFEYQFQIRLLLS